MKGRNVDLITFLPFQFHVILLRKRLMRQHLLLFVGKSILFIPL
ncbi:hypothetical protein BCQ_0958 [Bacillus cereus Q1]|uniref:Uncharacterized protein n=1 Tax=Bacillus cereus (strain Q1) TaxID=361100 RepID=B9IRB3_BACCQ|nr:hypothetical protein BCQ_0958 [Bacillus cereus Q1]